jgi:hypothetical protein
LDGCGSASPSGITASVPVGIASPAETARKGNKRGLYEVAPTVALAATAKPSRAAQSARGIGCTAQIPSASTRAQAANSDTDSVGRGEVEAALAKAEGKAK